MTIIPNKVHIVQITFFSTLKKYSTENNVSTFFTFCDISSSPNLKRFGSFELSIYHVSDNVRLDLCQYLLISNKHHTLFNSLLLRNFYCFYFSIQLPRISCICWTLHIFFETKTESFMSLKSKKKRVLYQTYNTSLCYHRSW